MNDSFEIVMRLVERMLDAEAMVKELEGRVQELSVFGNKPNPALENVLAKLREYINRSSGCHDEYKILSDGKDSAGLTFGDLRRWIESEKEAGK